MKISKTGFINLIRCNRFAGLEEIYRKKGDSLVSFSEDLDDLMTIENLEKRNILLDDMWDLEGEESDLLRKDDPQFEVMMPYYNEIEVVSAKSIKDKFKGNLIFNTDTFKQKSFKMERDGYSFYCFLDGFLETKDQFSVFETKATTTRKFLAMAIKGVPIFVYNDEGVLCLKKDLGYSTDETYNQKEERFYDKYSQEGRYVYDLAFQRYIIENADGFKKNNNNKYYLAVLNSEYVFDGSYDENDKPIYDNEIIVFIDFTRITENYMPIIEEDMKQVIFNLNRMVASPVPLGRYCQRKDRKQCKFYDICFSILPKENSLFTYLDSHHGFKDEEGNKHDRFDLINKGVTKMLDIPESWLTRPNNVIQRQVVESGVIYYDTAKIRAGINQLRYPIYHLDFESFPGPLPRFRGEKPYAQSLFQFSIHIETEPGVIDKDKDNYYFLAKDHKDHREELIQAMIDVIKPDGGSVLVYNIAFEKTRIKELGLMFPKYKNRLEDISDRLFDLMDIVKGNTKFYEALGYEKDRAKTINYYHTKLNGSFSIKKVLPLFSNLTYDDLEVANGGEALASYGKFPLMDEKTFNETYANMLEYCKQDTWAMVEILDKLREI